MTTSTSKNAIKERKVGWNVYHAEECVYYDPNKPRIFYGYHISFSDGGQSDHPFAHKNQRDVFENEVRLMVRRESGRKVPLSEAAEIGGVWCVLRNSSLDELWMRGQLETRWKLTSRELKQVIRGCQSIYDDVT
jgi:hypothetical protein